MNRRSGVTYSTQQVFNAVEPSPAWSVRRADWSEGEETAALVAGHAGLSCTFGS